MPRVLLLLPSTTYRAEAFLNAALKLGVDVTCASEFTNTMTPFNPSGLITLPLSDPNRAAQMACEFAAQFPIDAVVPVDSQAVVAGAAIGRALSLPHNSVESARAALNKYAMRTLLRDAGFAVPEFRLASFEDDLEQLAQVVKFPCVVKPLHLAASQGVMRADDPTEFRQSVARLIKIVATCDVAPSKTGDDELSDPSKHFLIEDFVPGPEFAIEGLLTAGRITPLAIFDKPDPLDGPFFEETIYVTPSRRSPDDQRSMLACAQRAATAIGLVHGPVHIELRWSEQGPVIIEINPRTIGGQCSRVLSFGTGMSLEEVVIRHAVDPEFQPPQRHPQPAGVMMIPIPAGGVLDEVQGSEEARTVPGIVDIRMTAHRGQQLIPLPEGGNYLGFIFARGDSVQTVEGGLTDGTFKAGRTRVAWVS